MTDRDLFIAVLCYEDPAERAAYLRDACGPDSEQRQRIVELLKMHEGAGDFLEPPAVVLPPRDAQPELSANSESTVIGPYRLLHEIGEGGMGTVYMAEQTSPMRRLVALKVIKGEVSSKLVLARFEAERQALALMDHPNIARVFDAGTTDAGRPYFVMEIVKGVPITTFCDERRLTPRERLDLFIPVCHAVQHAHQKGIIHRDLKPANVMVATYDGQPVPKVIDFGVAKATGTRMTDRTLYTEFGTVIGTLEYMSPEQAELNQLDIDTRSDIYSLGVLLYELLTGSTPLDRSRLRRAAFLELLRAIREEESTRPSVRLSTTEELPSIAASRGIEPRKLSGLMRRELDWIVMKALEKDRRRRYETANGLASDLRRYLDGEPVQACPPSAGYRLRKLVGRHKVAIAAATLSIMALAVGMVVSTWQALRARQAERQIAAALRAAEQQRDLAALRTREAADRARSLDRQLYVSRVDRAYAEWSINNIAEAEQLLHACPVALRGWEWHYSHRLCHLDSLTYNGHSRAATAAAFSPDGTRIVSGAGGGWISTQSTKVNASEYMAVGELAVWEPKTGREIFVRRGLSGGIQDVAYSPDGTRIASCNRSGGFNVWDAETGDSIFSGTESNTQGLCVAFTPDGTHVAIGFGYFHYPLQQGYCKILDAKTGDEIRRFPGPVGGVQGVSISPDGRRIALTGVNTVDFWEVRSGSRLPSIPGAGQSQMVHDAIFSPDGRRLACAGDDVRIWDVATGECLLTLRGPTGGVYGLAYSRDGSQIAAASDDRSVTLWDAKTGGEIARFRGHTTFVKSVAFSPDDNYLVSACNDGQVKVWDVRRSHPIAFSPRSTRAFHGGGIAFSSDSRRLAASWDIGNLGLWDAATGEPLVHLSNGVQGLAFSPNRRELATAQTDATIKLRDAATGAITKSLSGHRASVYRVAYSPDGTRLASGGSDCVVRLWDATSGHSAALHPSHGGVITGLAFSPDGLRLASAADHAELMLWDLETGRLLFHRTRPMFPIGHPGTSIAFSPDGRHVAWANHIALEVYDASSGDIIQTLRGHTARIMSVAYSPDGSRLASASRDRTIKLWDPATGEETFTLRGHTGSAFCLAFSPDGNRLASEDMMSNFRIWDATPLGAGKHRLAAPALRQRSALDGTIVDVGIPAHVANRRFAAVCESAPTLADFVSEGALKPADLDRTRVVLPDDMTNE